MLECRDLRRRFGDLIAVDGVGFHIDPGETYGLLGPNGAGKTTTISMIAGLLESDDGEIVVAGEPMTTRAIRARSAIGYVPQDLAIYPDLSARENLMFFARLYGMSTAEAKHRSDEVLEVTGLSDRAHDQTKKYSGGMKRRLNIGIGLCCALRDVSDCSAPDVYRTFTGGWWPTHGVQVSLRVLLAELNGGSGELRLEEQIAQDVAAAFDGPDQTCE